VEKREENKRRETWKENTSFPLFGRKKLGRKTSGAREFSFWAQNFFSAQFGRKTGEIRKRALKSKDFFALFTLLIFFS
jgi:hypothetical protein